MVVEQEVSTAAQRQPVERDSAARLREVEPMVRAICRNRLGDVDGDDAAQRALLTVWRKLESERGVDCLPTYAATCARYETFSEYRNFQRSATPGGDLSEALWADPDPGPAEHAERVDEVAHARERVEALLAQLSPRQAEVMRASVLADRSTADAAAELGITPTGVRAAQVRAMARMRELSGARSPNPQALNLTSEERGKRDWEAEKARRLSRQTNANNGDSPDAGLRDAGDPLARARVAVEALHGERDSASRVEGEGTTDPMDRARTAVNALPAAADVCDEASDGAVSTDLDQSQCDKERLDSSAAYGFDQAEHATDTASAA